MICSGVSVCVRIWCRDECDALRWTRVTPYCKFAPQRAPVWGAFNVNRDAVITAVAQTRRMYAVSVSLRVLM